MIYDFCDIKQLLKASVAQIGSNKLIFFIKTFSIR